MVTVAWDVDDVLNELTTSFIDWTGHRIPRKTSLKVGSPADFAAKAGVDSSSYLRELDRFRLENFEGLVPSAPVLEWFRTSNVRCHHIALTRTPLATAPASVAWVMKHFGTWIRAVAVAPSVRETDPPETVYETKAQMLSRVCGQVILVDDSTENLAGLTGNSRVGLLFPAPWNANGALSVEDALAELTDLIRGRTHDHG